VLPSAGLFCLFVKHAIFAVMNNLPSNLTRHTVFRDNDYSHTLVFPNDYVLPAAEDMAMQVRKNGVIVADVSATIVKDGQRVTFTYTKETLALVPGYHFQYFLINGTSILGGELMVIIGVGEQDITESVIEVTEEGVTVVIVQGLALVQEQVALATQAAADALVSANEASSSATDAEVSANNAATAAGQAATSASGAATSASAAATAETNAEAAQVAAEEASELAIAARRTRINTFALMLAACEPNEPRDFTVINDEFQDDENVPYIWDGVFLFEYNGFDICDQQP
jgi:hypothetical protein